MRFWSTIKTLKKIRSFNNSTPNDCLIGSHLRESQFPLKHTKKYSLPLLLWQLIETSLNWQSKPFHGDSFYFKFITSNPVKEIKELKLNWCENQKQNCHRSETEVLLDFFFCSFLSVMYSVWPYSIKPDHDQCNERRESLLRKLLITGLYMHRSSVRTMETVVQLHKFH